MSHWNHRVMRRTYPTGEVIDGIYEVYYNEDGKAEGWTTDPVSPSFFVNEDDEQESILDDIRRFERATTMPILDWETGKEID